MVKVGNKAAIALLALSFCLLPTLLLSGCVSNKYVPCCVKSSIYQESGLPFADPICVFQNGTQYSAIPCKLPPDTKSVAFCSNGTTCADIASEEECTATWDCSWDASLTPKCQGALAYMPLPVCTDLVPSSCTNNKCTAMICGYTDIRPSPPPASQDWDAETASSTFENNPDALPSNLPANDMQLPTIGLQEATCSFDTMGNKLYNKVKASRGALWVNSFRFGVGSSFSDFEAAKNYFPATDHACAVNQYANVDRFTVYLGAYSFCQPSTTYYQCSGPKLAGMIFKTNTSCALYCGGGAPPYACNKIVGGEAKYMCNQDGFAYDTQAICESKCSRIDDPNACANDTSIFPFLATDTTGKASYRMKYVSDYVLDVNSIHYKGGACMQTAGPDGGYPFYRWVANTLEEPVSCNDYVGKPNEEWWDGPWFSTYNNSAINAWRDPTDPYYCAPGASCDFLGEQRTYFDNHAYSALDFDYEFYAKALLEQYPDPVQKLPFECESSTDCLSGACDTTHYNRPMCSDLNGNAVACACSAKEFGSSHLSYPSCSLVNSTGDSLTVFADTGLNYGQGVSNNIVSEVLSKGPMFYPVDSYHIQATGAATLHFKYYVKAPAADSSKPTLFEICGVPPVGGVRVQKCIDYDRYVVVEGCNEYGDDCTYDIVFTTEKVIWDPSGGECHYTGEGEPGWPASNPARPNPSYYWEYDFNLGSPNPASTVNMEKLGNCALNGDIDESKDPVPPYLEMKNLGWCAGCSYTTLAVQKVDWNASENPGGYGTPRPLACYEYRGEFNYVPSASKALYGGNVEQYSTNYWYMQPEFDGQVRYGTSSTEPVRYDSNPSAYQSDKNGNIAIYWGPEGLDHPVYICDDKWHASTGWWKKEELPTPSAPYLKEKLTSYLQSNIMPILDEINEKTRSNNYTCTYESMYSYRCSTNNQAYPFQDDCNYFCSNLVGINDGYDPLFICNTAGGDGGVLHVIGNTSMLSPGAHAGVSDYGSIYPPDINSDLLSYMDISGTNTVFFPPDSTGGKNAIIMRTEFLKSKCDTPPLVGLEILPGENETTLIGNETDPGKLHTFFFKPGQLGYDQRVGRGLPDKYPKKVDILMQDWYPLCKVGSSLYQGEREVYEFERRMEFSRALLANFSKPSLVWKFAFPQNSLCNQTFFLDYLFNNTQTMVDSGITGLIYSDWSMKDGLGYGPEYQYYDDTDTYTTVWPESPPVTHALPNLALKTGLTMQTPVVRGGTEENKTYVLDDRAGGTGKTSLFCALEKYSLRSIGYISLTYGQKLYAENQTCYCTPCTNSDVMSDLCNINGPNNEDILQLYCNDGTKCTMPDGQTQYNMYKCEPRCMNYTACKSCTSPLNANYASFCRFTEPGGATSGYSRDYSNITDDYWEFLTGLSPSEKCCIDNTKEGMAGTKYTYVGLTGSKQQSVFLQYPTRGELDIDCGRAPDTSVLEYCNIKVPISQKEIACMKIDKPATPIQIVPENSAID